MLDERVQLRPGQLGVVYGTGGIGKSTLLSCAARRTAVERGLPVLHACAEVDDTGLWQRYAAAEAGVELALLLDESPLGTADTRRLQQARQRLQQAAITTLCPHAGEPPLTVTAIAERVAERRELGGLPALVVVDCLRMLTPEPERNRPAAPDMLRDLKLLAVAEQVAVLVAHRLNPYPVGDRLPRPEDTLDPAAVAEHADVALLLHDPAAADPQQAGLLDIVVAKTRAGSGAQVVSVAREHQYARLVERIVLTELVGDAEPESPPERKYRPRTRGGVALGSVSRASVEYDQMRRGAAGYDFPHYR